MNLRPEGKPARVRSACLDWRLETALALLTPSGRQRHEEFRSDFEPLDTLRAAPDRWLKPRPPASIRIRHSGRTPDKPKVSASLEDCQKASSRPRLRCRTQGQSVAPGVQPSGHNRINDVISTFMKIPIKGLDVPNNLFWAATGSVNGIGLPVDGGRLQSL